MSNAAVKNDSRFMIKIVHDEDAQSPREDDNLGKMICWHSRYRLGDEHNFDDPRDFFKSLVSDSLQPKDIISYVKDGNADGLKLEYNKSTREWDLNSYWDYTKTWYTEYTAGASLDMTDDVLSDKILDEMQLGDLQSLAVRNNCILPLNLYDHSILSISVQSFHGRAHHADWDSGQVGWVYASHEDIVKEYGSVSPENIEKAEKLLKGEVETYDCYLRGECYGFQLYENGEEKDSCWGFIGSFDEAIKSIREYIPSEAAPLMDDMQYGDKEEEIETDFEDETEDEV